MLLRKVLSISSKVLGKIEFLVTVEAKVDDRQGRVKDEIRRIRVVVLR